MAQRSFESVVGASHVIVDCGAETVLAYAPDGQRSVHVMSQTSLAGQRPRFDALLVTFDLPSECTQARDVVDAVVRAVQLARSRAVTLASRPPAAGVHAPGW